MTTGVDRLRERMAEIADLGNVTRLGIVGALAQGSLNASAMTPLTEMTQPAANHHLSLLRASKAIDGLKKLEGDEAVGARIVRRALEEPIRQIVENSGLEGSVIVEKVKAETVPTRGFDADSMEFVDMLQAGIIDPTKVERSALQNAASVAALLLMTEAVITDMPEEKPAGGGAPHMPHGDF